MSTKKGSATTHETPIQVLHVDDDEDFLICSKRKLEKHGPFQVDNALSISEALLKIEQKLYGLIISDYQMQGRTGLEFLKEIRDAGNNVPFFLLTGESREDLIIEALNLGADRYFNKNGNLETLYFEIAHGIKKTVKTRRAEETLQQNQEVIEVITQGLDVGLVIVSNDYRILWSNFLPKQDIENVVGKKCYFVIHQRDNLCSSCGVKQVFETKKDRVVIEKFDSGFGKPCSWLESTATPIKDENGNITAALELVIPIDDRKKAEIALKDSETKFRAITASARDGIILIDDQGKIVHWNPAAETIFGYTNEEAIGKNLHFLIAPKQFHEKYSEGFLNFKQTGKGEAVGKTLELDGIQKDGKTIAIEISLSSLKLKEKWHALAIVRNNTERKAAWTSLEESINELVKINEKLGVVGRLTRHDARNKLSVILNNIYLAKKMLDEKQVALGYLQAIESAVDQMEKIFEFARTYEMLGIEELADSDVEKSFDEAAVFFSDVEQIKFVNECAGLTVLADSLLRQLFYNLIHNSLMHGENVTQIRVYPEMENKQLKLVYEDNGIGIPEDEKEKIFGEGYGKGTGYGLYLIRKICEAYGWTIQESGVPGKGARFVMTIPEKNKDGKLSYRFDLKQL